MTKPLIATYRLQFGPDFSFTDAARLAPYIAALGASHVYASPVFAARPGSTHGYDMTDPRRLNPELGGAEGFAAMSEALKAAGLGLILDIVPNHMAAHHQNPYWTSALEFGAASPWSDVFDIDWAKAPIELPFMGTTYDEALKAGGLSLVLDTSAARIDLTDGGNRWPLRPATVAEILRAAATASGIAELGAAADRWRALDGGGTDAAIVEARWALRRAMEVHAEPIRAAIARRDVARTVEAQHWRPVSFRRASERLDFRRFFNITDLVGVRVEDPAVFRLVHELPLRLIAEGHADGLRVDHVDGLADPAAYCRDLRAAAGPDVPIFVEKILGPEEGLRDWPIEGTTGYERLNTITSLLVDANGYRQFELHLRREGGLAGEPRQRLAAAKRLMLEESFGAEVETLARLAARIAGADETPLREAVMRFVMHFPVYRSYADAKGGSDQDRAVWREALDGIADAAPETRALAARIVGILDRGEGADATLFRRRLQQLTGPAMAKGYEDTELYRFVALGSVNEVGSALEKPFRAATEVLAREAARAAARRVDLQPLATHDTKRGADTRARLSALSGMPHLFLGTARRWQRRHAGLKRAVEGSAAPDAVDEWILYQTLVGAWPIGLDRIKAYLMKVMREGKRHTRWETPDTAYEDATFAFAEALLTGQAGAVFRDELEALVARLAAPGRIAGLVQVILQMTLPGTPDIYRGTELWDHTLVDPDNRRPVDWTRLKEAYECDRADDPRVDEVGIAKFHLTRTLLRLRRANLDLFTRGDLVPLRVAASHAGFVGFTRGHEGASLLVLVPTRFRESWEEDIAALSLPADLAGSWADLFGGRDWQVGPTGIPAVPLDPGQPFMVALRAR
jgi:(1->4)-alpha-D-glucan 1-alpha-D-glucosylmutase